MKIYRKHFNGIFLGAGLEIAEKKMIKADSGLCIVSSYNGSKWFLKQNGKVEELDDEGAKLCRMAMLLEELNNHIADQTCGCWGGPPSFDMILNALKTKDVHYSEIHSQNKILDKYL